MSKELLVERKVLRQLANAISFTLDDFQKLGKQPNLELFLASKEKLARSQFILFRFNIFWEIFIYFLKGEIDTKNIVKNSMNQSREDTSSVSQEVGEIIYLSSFFVKHRQNLVEVLYDFVVEHFQSRKDVTSKEEIASELERIYNEIISALKDVFNLNDGLQAQIIEDIDLSLQSAFDLIEKL